MLMISDVAHCINFNLYFCSIIFSNYFFYICLAALYFVGAPASCIGRPHDVKSLVGGLFLVRNIKCPYNTRAGRSTNNLAGS